jgi:hypothetical protein
MSEVYHTRYARAKELGVSRRLFDRLVEKGLMVPDAKTTCAYELFSTEPEAIYRDKQIVEQYRAAKFLAENNYLLSTK